MSISHHPSDALLSAFVGGTLDEGLGLVMSSHAAMCGECSERIRILHEIGGALLDSIEPAALAPGAFNDVLARTRKRMPETHTKTSGSSSVSTHDYGAALPLPLGKHLLAAAAGDWRWLAPGVRQVELTQRTPERGWTRMLAIAPAMELPHHGHDGIELTLVLKGAFEDETGRYGIGDLAELDGEVHHQPVVVGSEECICLIATQSGLKFSTILGRMAGPLFGI